MNKTVSPVMKLIFLSRERNEIMNMHVSLTVCRELEWTNVIDNIIQQYDWEPSLGGVVRKCPLEVTFKLGINDKKE